jgi:flagellar motor switch protein FliN/FliY
MTDKENGIWQTFASDFGAEIVASLNERSEGAWQVQVAGPTAADDATGLKQLTIRFEGALRGICHIAFAEDEVARLASTAIESAESEQLVVQLMTAAATRLCSNRSSAYGSSRAHCEPGKTAAPTHAQSLRLELSDKQGAKVALLIAADTQLLQALSMKRAAADSAQLAAVQSLFEMMPDPGNLDVVMDVELDVTVRFGQRQLTLREVLDLTSGSVVELDRQVDEPVELLLDGKVIARGEAVVIDGNYGLRVTEVPHAIGSRLPA